MIKEDEKLREKILIVADPMSHPGLVTSVLSEAGYASTTIDDASRALEVLVRESPDLVLLDPALSRTEGLEFCFRVKTDYFTSHIPVVILGTTPRGAEHLQWYNCSADFCVDAPYNPRELIARIRTLLRRTVVYDQITHLATGAYLHRQVDAWLAKNEPTAVLYFDIDNFQSFTSRYGEQLGNEVMLRFARMIVDALPHGNVSAVHLGNDDFMAMLSPEYSATVADSLVNQFRQVRREFYPASDTGVAPRPLLSLSAAAVSNKNRVLLNYMQVTNLLSNSMRRIKAKGGDQWQIDA